MALHVTTRTEHSRSIQHPRRRGVAVGVTLSVALALALGVGVRAQLRQTAPAAPVANVWGQEASGSAVSMTNSPVPVLYLVVTQEEADWVRRFTYEVGQVSGQPVSAGAVALPRTADDAEVDGLPRAPGTRIFDLR